MTHSTLTVHGYTPVVSNHVYRKPLPRERGPSDQEVVVVSSVIFMRPTYLVSTLAKIAKAMLADAPGFPDDYYLSTQIQRYSQTELEAIANPSDICRWFFEKAIPVVSPDQERRSLRGLEMMIGCFPSANWTTLDQRARAGERVLYEPEIQNLGSTRANRARSWMIRAEIPTGSHQEPAEAATPNDHFVRSLHLKEVTNGPIAVEASGIDRRYLGSVCYTFGQAVVAQDAWDGLVSRSKEYVVQTIADTLKAVKDCLESGEMSRSMYEEFLGISSS